jgi:hypothetical protein
MNELQRRLVSLRHRLRFVVVFRGVCWLLAILFLTATVVGWLDWRVPLPGLVRAVALTGALSGLGYIGIRLLLRPLRTPSDDLALTLRIENVYPALKDQLASSVQFMEAPDDSESLGSASLRQQVVQDALRNAEHLDFNRIVNTRGLPSAGLMFLGAGAVLFVWLFFYPAKAWTALERLAIPFGDRDWPGKTRLEIQAPPGLIARGEPLEIRGRVFGVIPAQAQIEFDGLSPARQACPVQPGREPNTGSLLIRRDRVDRNFRFQVRANDALSDWYEVKVLPPPVLVPLGGRASPQVHLQYPGYTDLRDSDLPEGSGNIEAVAGTQVSFRAATDRSVARAWIEYRPEPAVTLPAAGLSFLGINHPAAVLVPLVTGQSIWDRVAVEIDSTGRELTARFAPKVTGAYALRFEDEAGLGNVRLFDLRIFRDPEPIVTLQRPSPSYDNLDVVPGAEFTLQVTADDPQFAVRSLFVEYRCRKSDAPRKLALYDHEAVGKGLAGILSGLAGQRFPIPELRLRPPQLTVTKNLSINHFRHPDGRPLKEGDVLVLQFCADDFDDVSLDKKPGRSHEVELRIVGRATLEAVLEKTHAQVQQELVRLQKLQQQAIQHVIGPEQEWRHAGRLRNQDVDQLIQAEQVQQQIRARVGTVSDGLRGELAKSLRTLRDNHLPTTTTRERLEIVAKELARLAQRELEQIEPRLTQARKEKAGAKSQKTPEVGRGPLGEVRQFQEEVATTFADLLKLLEPWAGINELKAEAKTILQEQNSLQQETKNLDKDETRGQGTDRLPPPQRAALDKSAESQQKLAERASELFGKMKRMARDQKVKDAALAEKLDSAAAVGAAKDIGGQMKIAADRIKANQLGDALKAQQNAREAMENMVQALEERREEDLERLRKKLQEAENTIAKLADRQEQLQKKVKEAEKIIDPEKRRQELQRLSRQQEQLQKEAHAMLRELTRLRAEGARQALSDAGDSMDQARQQLTRDQDSDEAQEEALDRLNETRRALKQGQREVEEELAREKLAKVAEEIKRLKERQEAALNEGERIFREVLQRKIWDRGHRISLADLATAQKLLAEETETLTKNKLARAQVFTKMLAKSTEAMTRAAESIQQQMQQANDDPKRVVADSEYTKHQREAVRRIDQLLDAVKPEKGMGQASPPTGDGSTSGGSKGRPGDESLSLLAQLKGLRILQKELNDHTDRFAKNHPDVTNLKSEELRELELIRNDQKELAELLDELTKPMDCKGNDK